MKFASITALVFALVLSACGASGSSESTSVAKDVGSTEPLTADYLQLDGSYRLVEGDNCASNLQITASASEEYLRVLDGNGLTVAGFEQIDGDAIRVSGDAFVHSEHASESGENELVTYTRECRGIVFSSCGDWEILSHISWRENEVSLNYSAGLEVSCRYQR